MEFKTIKQRRQIRTTLNDEQEALLKSVCKFRGEKESIIVREAIVKYLHSALSEGTIHKNHSSFDSH